MSIYIKQGELSRALDFARKAIGSKNSMPILTHAHLATDPAGFLTVTATNLERWHSERIACTFDLTGPERTEDTAFCVPAAPFAALVAALPAGADVILDPDDKSLLRLTSTNINTTFRRLPAEEFPLRSADEERSVCLEMAATLFAEGLGRTEFAMATDTTRQHLVGIQMEIEPGGIIHLVATDQHRLAHWRVREPQAVSGLGAETRSCIIPAESVKEFLAALSKAEGRADIRITTTGLMTLDMGERVITTRLVEGQYPNWRRVCPTEGDCERSVTVDANDLLLVLRRASVYWQSKIPRVTFRPAEDRSHAYTVLVRSSDFGQFDEVIEVAQGGEPMAWAMNGPQIMDALRAAQSDGVRFEQSEALRPQLLVPSEQKPFSHWVSVAMPMVDMD